MPDQNQGQSAQPVQVNIRNQNGVVILEFGRPVSWLGLPQVQAVQVAKMILKTAGAKKIEIEL